MLDGGTNGIGVSVRSKKLTDGDKVGGVRVGRGHDAWGVGAKVNTDDVNECDCKEVTTEGKTDCMCVCLRVCEER